MDDAIPPQQQDHQPGREREMTPAPDYAPRFPGAGRLKGKAALITGGDSGIGRAVAVSMAREGADVAIVYLDEHEDAADTVALIEAEGARGLRIAGDVGDENFCRAAVDKVVSTFGKLDILVNNAAEQHTTSGLGDLTAQQLERTFRTNVFGYFFMSKMALQHMTRGGAIVNTTSVTAYKGSPHLLDYSATRGAVLALTRSLSQLLVEAGIRVNAVAPGPIWTPLIPASFAADKVAEHGKDTPMGRPGQPNEVASCHVFLASDEASYMTGQVMHPNGGTIVNS
ncbi:SDR family oxidoreductase [Nitrospirillum sp. BR 11828]|uniref:SDR family oxidoreductase n=1 Tax=Nitrospirillum sp. BR 11828 TaxID=3104325 RepID=UPI002ACAD9A2|nr:SDR family oxidoreductase [Nitrospirillum sp. BR 11828]MDZ5648581.1 SDR family oxidoreductase [Nitrospirillum sp. BR 11828]